MGRWTRKLAGVLGFFVFLFAHLAEAASPRPLSVHSAVRGPRESARTAYNRYLSRLGTRSVRAQQGGSAVNMAKPLNQLDVSLIPSWPDGQSAQSALARGFFGVRNLRFLETHDHPGFKRRSSWFFPDDGCFARAALMGQNLAKAGYPRPAKVFIFGNLQVKTPNSPDGQVSWWYHVVPIVRVGNTAYVLDPAIDPTQPLTLQAWVMTMTRDPKSVTASICSPFAYTPSSDCLRSTAAEEAPARQEQQNYLMAEWDRVESMGRDPKVELGDHPVWRK